MSTDLTIVGLSGEEIAKRRILYESAKRNNLERVASPDEVLKYLEVIQFQSQRLEQLEDEMKEVRSKGEKQLVATLASINETLKLLKQYVEKK
jgi:hypothetical protein